MRWAKIGLLATAMLCPVAAQAQTQPDATNATGTPDVAPDIVVTAQRHEQRLQDVPLSVSAITSAQLEARNVTNIQDLQYSVPGLSAYEYGPGNSFVQIRGVSTTLGRPTVGIYLDEMPITFDTEGGALDMRLLDMERVEVLRGPQATLYGEGSMGGTIRYITASPKLDQVSGSFEGETGGTKGGGWSYQANGVLNLPIVRNRLGVRLVAGYEKIGGYIDDDTTGQQNVNGAEIKTVRGKLLFKPVDDLAISLLALHQESDQNYQNFGINGHTSSAVPTFNHDNYELYQANLDYDLGGVELNANAGYINRRSSNQTDLTPFYLPTVESAFMLPPGFITQIPLTAFSNYDVYTGEVRLASRSDGPFFWQIGATYRDSNAVMPSAASTAPGTIPITLLSADQGRRSKAYAVYGELSYRLTEKLTVLGGLRYYRDSENFNSESVSFGFPTADVGTGTFHSANPRVNIKYEFSPDSMIYANVAKGFRSGGFNLTSAGGGVYIIPPTYKPDRIWTYEAGTKQQIFDRRLILDAAVYYSDWTDVQSDVFAPGSPIIIVMNSGRVNGWGVDFSASAHPTRALTLSASYGWNNLDYATDTADKQKGDPVDGAVRESWSASLDYRRSIAGDTQGFFRADYQHAGHAQITLRNFGGQVIERPSRDLVNLRVGLALDRFEISAFANNAFDEDAPIIVGPFGVLLENVEQRPRVIGINVKAKF